MIDVHSSLLMDLQVGGQCRVTWGVMAPADGQPGQLHICHVDVGPVEVGELAEQVKHDRHDGPHRCECGETAERDPGLVVVCAYPIPQAPLGLCGVTVTGVETVDYRGPRRLGRDQMRAQTVLSVPCGHPTQRQAS